MKIKINWNLLSIILLSLLIYSCVADTEEKSGSASPKEYKAINPIDQSTKDMIDEVQNAYAKVDPSQVPYVLNHIKVKNLKEKIDKMEPGAERDLALYDYALELLRSGDAEEAIKIFESFISFYEDKTFLKKETMMTEFMSQLSICYLRKAEQENCILNHTNESCIIPISPKGQHVNKESSRTAIYYLNKCLEKNPFNYEHQYLLNIAHMTIGTYPDSIAEEYLIPEDYFTQNNLGKFEDVASSLGVDINGLSGGICLDDFNNDNYLDLIVSSWGFNDQIRYFENDTKGGFIDRTEYSGLVGVTGGLNLKHADFNNDGWLDFIILRGAWLENYGDIPNSLIRNNGDGTFTDVTKEVGMYSKYPTQTAIWADFNLDGWLDVFIANESKETSENSCELFLSEQNGKFREVANQANLDQLGFFKGADTGDFNNDGYPDLYISNFHGANLLYINNGVKQGLSFSLYGDTTSITSKPNESFSTWVFDYNNDGLEDIFVSGYSNVEKSPSNMMMANVWNPFDPRIIERRPKLYRNEGNLIFSEVGHDMGLLEPAPTMGCNFGDLDNDGFLDFYLATGDPSFLSIVPNRMYRNVGGDAFEDVTFSGGFGSIQKGHAVGFGDLDMDGDQDIYTVMGGAYEGDNFQNLLFENPIGNKNNWINLKLVGTTSNQSAIGAKIIITIQEENGSRRKIHQKIGSGASFGGNSLLAEIGIGQASIIDRLEIIWPNANQFTSLFNNVPINSHIKITEGQDGYETQEITPSSFESKNLNHQHNH